MASETNGPATKRDIERVVELVQQLHQDLDRRLEAMDRRLDRITESMVAIQGQLAAVTRWSDRVDRDYNTLLATRPRSSGRSTTSPPGSQS